MDAWDLVMRALSHYWRVTRQDNVEAARDYMLAGERLVGRAAVDAVADITEANAHMSPDRCISACDLLPDNTPPKPLKSVTTKTLERNPVKRLPGPKCLAGTLGKSKIRIRLFRL